MNIHTYWRWEPNDGVPELLVAVDEYTMDVNSDYWHEECAKAQQAHPNSDWRIIVIRVDDLAQFWTPPTVTARSRHLDSDSSET